MIVICPSAINCAEANHEWRFLQYYLSNTSNSALISNQVWSSFKYKLRQSVTNEDKFNEIRGLYLGTMFEPENIVTDPNTFEENAEEKDYSFDELIESTCDLVNRKWANIDYLITQDPNKYDSIKVRKLTLEEFLQEIMSGSEVERELYGAFARKEIFDTNNF